MPALGVPRTTWLVDQVFPALSRSSFPGVNQSPGSPWEPARWAAGPFTATLADGSAVDYVWYRFVDQPAIARLGLGASQLDKLQQFAASLHEHWGVAGPSLAMPSSGTLATLDPAQIVTPPAGLENGYVPIVIRQR